MRVNDAVFGILLLVFSGLMIAYTRSFPATLGQRYGPDLFPILIGIGFAVCGAFLTVRGIARRKDTPLVRFGDWARDPNRVVNFLLVLACLVFYILAAETVGFIPIAFLILFVLLKRFGAALLPAFAVGLAATAVIHTVFVRFLLVPLPWGLLTPVAW